MKKLNILKKLIMINMFVVAFIVSIINFSYAEEITYVYSICDGNEKYYNMLVREDSTNKNNFKIISKWATHDEDGEDPSYSSDMKVSKYFSKDFGGVFDNITDEGLIKAYNLSLEKDNNLGKLKDIILNNITKIKFEPDVLLSKNGVNYSDAKLDDSFDYDYHDILTKEAYKYKFTKAADNSIVVSLYNDGNKCYEFVYKKGGANKISTKYEKDAYGMKICDWVFIADAGSSMKHYMIISEDSQSGTWNFAKPFMTYPSYINDGIRNDFRDRMIKMTLERKSTKKIFTYLNRDGFDFYSKVADYDCSYGAVYANFIQMLNDSGDKNVNVNSELFNKINVSFFNLKYAFFSGKYYFYIPIDNTETVDIYFGTASDFALSNLGSSNLVTQGMYLYKCLSFDKKVLDLHCDGLLQGGEVEETEDEKEKELIQHIDSNIANSPWKAMYNSERNQVYMYNTEEPGKHFLVSLDLEKWYKQKIWYNPVDFNYRYYNAVDSTFEFNLLVPCSKDVVIPLDCKDSKEWPESFSADSNLLAFFSLMNAFNYEFSDDKEQIHFDDLTEEELINYLFQNLASNNNIYLRVYNLPEEDRNKGRIDIKEKNLEKDLSIDVSDWLKDKYLETYETALKDVIKKNTIELGAYYEYLDKGTLKARAQIFTQKILIEYAKPIIMFLVFLSILWASISTIMNSQDAKKRVLIKERIKNLLVGTLMFCIIGTIIVMAGSFVSNIMDSIEETSVLIDPTLLDVRMESEHFLLGMVADCLQVITGLLNWFTSVVFSKVIGPNTTVLNMYDIVYNSGLDSDVTLYPFSNAEWSRYMQAYQVLSVIMAGLLMIAILKMAFGFIIQSGDGQKIAAEKETLRRISLAFLAIIVGPYIVRLVLTVCNYLVSLIPMKNMRIDLLFDNVGLLGAIANFLYASIKIKIYFVFVVRKVMIAFMLIITPIVFGLWAINDKFRSLSLWMGELFTNGLTQLAYALTFFVIVLIAGQSQNQYVLLILMMTIMKLADFFKDSVQGLMQKWGGINETAVASQMYNTGKSWVKKTRQQAIRQTGNISKGLGNIAQYIDPKGTSKVGTYLSNKSVTFGNVSNLIAGRVRFRPKTSQRTRLDRAVSFYRGERKDLRNERTALSNVNRDGRYDSYIYEVNDDIDLADERENAAMKLKASSTDQIKSLLEVKALEKQVAEAKSIAKKISKKNQGESKNGTAAGGEDNAYSEVEAALDEYTDEEAMLDAISTLSGKKGDGYYKACEEYLRKANETLNKLAEQGLSKEDIEDIKRQIEDQIARNIDIPKRNSRNTIRQRRVIEEYEILKHNVMFEDDGIDDFLDIEDDMEDDEQAFNEPRYNTRNNFNGSNDSRNNHNNDEEINNSNDNNDEEINNSNDNNDDEEINNSHDNNDDEEINNSNDNNNEEFNNSYDNNNDTNTNTKNEETNNFDSDTNSFSNNETNNEGNNVNENADNVNDDNRNEVNYANAHTNTTMDEAYNSERTGKSNNKNQNQNNKNNQNNKKNNNNNTNSSNASSSSNTNANTNTNTRANERIKTSDSKEVVESKIEKKIEKLYEKNKSELLRDHEMSEMVETKAVEKTLVDCEKLLKSIENTSKARVMLSSEKIRIMTTANDTISRKAKEYIKELKRKKARQDERDAEEKINDMKGREQTEVEKSMANTINKASVVSSRVENFITNVSSKVDVNNFVVDGRNKYEKMMKAQRLQQKMRAATEKFGNTRSNIFRQFGR